MLVFIFIFKISALQIPRALSIYRLEFGVETEREGMEEQKEAELGDVVENEKELEEVVQALPSDAVNHLLSLGVS